MKPGRLSPSVMYSSIAQYVSGKEELAFEYELQYNGDNVEVWKRYIDYHKSSGNHSALSWVYERCCYQFPDSKEMWTEYLQWRLTLLEGVNPVVYAEEFDKCTRLFEKALYLCHREVHLWEMYLQHCLVQKNLSLIRKVLDHSLRCAALESHLRLWSPVIAFIESLLFEKEAEIDYDDELDLIIQQSFPNHQDPGKAEPVLPDIWASRLLGRYMEIAEDQEHVLFLLSLTKDYPTIVKIFGDHIVAQNAFKPTNHSLFYFYKGYLEALEKTGSQRQYLKAMEVCLDNFPEQRSHLVITLSKYYLKNKEFAQARSVLQECLSSTMTSEAFGEIYDFLVKILELYVSNCIQEAQDATDPDKRSALDPVITYNIGLLEYLMEAHSSLMNDLKLRQNINNVATWLERVSLYASSSEKLDVYTEAILKIDPALVSQSGDLGKLWCGLAQLYSDSNEVDSAKETLDRGTRVPFKFMQDLEMIWLKWAEFELEQSGLADAITILETALTIPSSPDLLIERYHSGEGNIPAKAIIFTSPQLWSLYLDLLEASSNIEKVTGAYEQLIVLKLATPLQFLNYVKFLQAQERWEDSFRVYERAVSTFPPETTLDLWSFYLNDSLVSNRQVETIRDLFESSLRLAREGVDCSSFFIQYSEFEQKQGFFKRAVDILARGCSEVADESSNLKLWGLCLERCKTLLGLESSRPLYEKCIRSVPNSKAMSFILEFAKMEEVIPDIARARTVFKFGAQLVHPDANRGLWDSWNDFELKHGDKESYKEMLRTKRQLMDTMKTSTEEISKQKGNIEFVSSKHNGKGAGQGTSSLELPQSTDNPEEISLDI
ncbi:LADA_0G13608g1_1 [Lachancea dasiensis]|uniref:Pre-mRNA-splicing factor SYF1 n=1 Tax=Lachancea dasiensis TaxID=1072105 RepID=A0A1G4JVR0_9SACH|nr:LADA_0G13608g1_1 [Lachancea dasiensis]